MTNAVLAHVYSQVPKLDCKGLCHEACGPIGLAGIEAQALQDDGIALPHVDSELTCSHLKGGRCTIYERRPLICRLFGNVRAMACPHGCKPAGGYLSDDEARALYDFLNAASDQPAYESMGLS